MRGGLRADFSRDIGREHSVKIKIDPDELLCDHDVVLTNYSSLQRYHVTYADFHWHRIILDECQEIKVATNKIASQCANLLANHRWMVSGTPLCSKIEDLHGELNFLKVWPFCLSNDKDGFWDDKIGKPFRRFEESALTLLYALLDAVMMRHSKSQRYLDDRQLVDMPSRTIEWRGFDIQNDSEKYIFKYLESFAADALDRFLLQLNDQTNINRSPHYAHIRSLLSVISKCITAPNNTYLRKIDHLRRMLGGIYL